MPISRRKVLRVKRDDDEESLGLREKPRRFGDGLTHRECDDNARGQTQNRKWVAPREGPLIGFETSLLYAQMDA